MEKSENSILIKEPEVCEGNNDIQETSEDKTAGESMVDDKHVGDAEKDSSMKIDFNDVTADADSSNESEGDDAKDVTKVTASLWKYQPIPNDEPEPFPEYITRHDKKDNAEIIGARVRGKKHKHEGTNCDDWFECEIGERVTCIAVSDGAGSKKYSRVGARSACKSAVGYLKSAFEDLFLNDADILSAISLPIDDVKCIDAYKKIAGIVQQSMIVAYSAVESAFYERFTDTRYSEALGREIGIKDFSSTLLIAVCIPVESDTDEKIVISCQIGDGMIALINSKESFENSLKLMGEADSGDFSGETDFLVNKKLLEPANLALRTKVSRGCSDIILLMTDGVADDYFPNESEMLRLYFDLMANGVLDSAAAVSTTDLSSKQVEIIKNIPKPVEYPWVNDKAVMVGLNYTKEIMRALDMSLKELWDNKFIASLASALVKEKMNTEEPAQRLKIWLDNYVERGSFDDRTMVVARI